MGHTPLQSTRRLARQHPALVGEFALMHHALVNTTQQYFHRAEEPEASEYAHPGVTPGAEARVYAARSGWAYDRRMADEKPDDQELNDLERVEAMTVADEIDAEMKPYRAAALGLYAGITHDVSERLTGHKVEEHFTSRKCSTEPVAREAEKILLAKGYNGGPGGGKDDGACVFVYAYVIRPTTKEAKRPFPLFSR